MGAGNEPGKPIWAKWQVSEGGEISVVLTYAAGGGYVQRERSFASLERAAASLGNGFGDVVRQALEAGSRRGRWRP